MDYYVCLKSTNVVFNHVPLCELVNTLESFSTREEAHSYNYWGEKETMCSFHNESMVG